MDNAEEEEEETYQFYTIKNDGDGGGVIDLQDILNLPTNPLQAEHPDNNKQIFYLAFGNTNLNEQRDDNVLLQTHNTNPQSEYSDNQALYSDDVKLITLEDGRMFVTTSDQVLSNVQTAPDPLLLSTISPPGDQEESSILKNEDSLETSDGFEYQLVQLADGSQAIIKLFKINADEALVDNDADSNVIKEEEEEEEPPKKVKKFQCLYEGCNKLYATSYHLTVHIRSHTDCRPFACHMEGCDKKFSTNYSLKAHIRTHTGEKPYGCTICTKEFKTSGDLQKHIRIHTGEKPFECPIPGCGKSFTTSNIRKVHIRSHTGERPYSCTYPHCGKAFTSSTNYKNHLRIHSGEKPYVCPIEGCGKRFTEYSSLYKHNAVHQPIRPHACLFCGQKFKQESALNFHKRLKHNVVVTKDGTEIIVKIE